LQNIGGKLKQLGGSFGQRSMMGGETDSLRHRNKLEDSITISYRYLDSTVNYKLDSSIIDFTKSFRLHLLMFIWEISATLPGHYCFPRYCHLASIPGFMLLMFTNGT
jgi:hypothetical protein